MGTDPAAPRAARTVLSASEIDRALTRIAHEILESNKGAEGLVLMGIPRRGAPLARRLGALLARIEPAFDPEAAVGEVADLGRLRGGEGGADLEVGRGLLGHARLLLVGRAPAPSPGSPHRGTSTGTGRGQGLS